LFRQKFFYGFFVEFIRFAFNDTQSPGGAFTKAGPQTITIKIGYHPGFAIYNFQCTFGAGWNAVAAAIAQLVINFYDLS
jgi:hypothetical protein